VANVLIQEAASWRLDEIYRYTRDRWGADQADRYITGLFDAFEGIDTHRTSSKPIPAEFGIDGYFFRYERHFVYWRRLSNGDIGIVTLLHERMHQIDRFRDDFGL
jgi:plasmid stabilization system protein ParE